MNMIEQESQHRGAVVAGLRALADALEADESLPVAHGLDLFAGFYREWFEDDTNRELTAPERFALLRTAASRYGAEITEHADGTRRAQLAFGPVSYRLHATPSTRQQEPRPRVVPADEDAALIGGAQ